jgi:hypothetical protein
MNRSPSNHLPNQDFAYNHRYAILGIVMIDPLMANLDGSMVNIVLPTITTTFQADLSYTQWVITANTKCRNQPPFRLNRMGYHSNQFCVCNRGVYVNITE